MNARKRARSDGYTLDDLRPLLIGPEQKRIHTLEHKFDNPEVMAESVGKVLPRATVISLGQGEDLASAMQPLLVSTIHETVRKEPKSFADAIYPSIGPAIRKAVIAALQESVDKLDEALQRTLTLESIQWRIEAARSGRSFAEVMLRHSFVHRIEHLFLMDRESALVLEHVAAEEVEDREPDQISAMR